MRKCRSKCCVCYKIGPSMCEPCKAVRRLLNALHKRNRIRLDDATMAARVEQYRVRVASGQRLFEPQRVA